LAHYALGRRRQAEEHLEIGRQLGNVKWATRLAVNGEYMLHQHRQALELLPAALAADGSARAQSELAIKECIILADGGQTAKARDKAVQSAASDTTTELRDRRAIKWMAAGWLCWELGEPPQAATWAAQSLALDSGMPNRLQGGALLARCGRLAEATRLLEEWPALELHNYRLGRLRLSSEIELARGNKAAATRLVREARQLDASAYGNLHDAWVLAHAGSPEEALAELERLLTHKSLQLQLSWPEPAGHWRRALTTGWDLSKKLGNPRTDWSVLLETSQL
jgi:tetratricopeptide (TPR) repeat protein